MPWLEVRFRGNTHPGFPTEALFPDRAPYQKFWEAAAGSRKSFPGSGGAGWLDHGAPLLLNQVTWVLDRASSHFCVFLSSAVNCRGWPSAKSVRVKCLA
jgi:hypothetical protein